MIKLLILLLLIFFSFINIYAADNHKLIKNHIFETYSEQEINDSIYVIHPYEEWFNNNGIIKNMHIHKWTSIWFLIWDNKIITKSNQFDNDSNKWLYIVCKPRVINNFLTENCYRSAQLLFYNKTNWLALLEVDWITWKSIENVTDLTNHKENGFKSYGMRYAEHSDLELSIDVFKDDIKVFHYQWEEWLNVEEGNFLANTIVFYNNSFFWINLWSSFISKSSILDFLHEKWEITKYIQDDIKYNIFVNEIDHHIKSIESYKEKLGIWYISFDNADSSIYQNDYIISNYDSLIKNNIHDWIYVWIQAHQNDFEELYDIQKNYYSNSDYEGLQNILTWWTDISSIDLIKIDSNKFSIKASDLFNNYEWKNTHFRIKMYLKSWESYYSNWLYLDGYFWLNSVGKASNWLSGIEWTIDYFLLRNKLKSIFKKRFSNLGAEKIASIKKSILDKLNIINKNIENQLLLIFKNINSEDDFIKNKAILEKYKDKIIVTSTIEEVLTFDSSFGNKLIDSILDSAILDSYTVDKTEKIKIYLWEK